MINEKMFELGNKGSAIRELFEYGKKRKALVGADKVYDFSLGNPSIPSPSIVNESLIKCIKEYDPKMLHAYTSGAGDLNTRDAIATYLNKVYNANTQKELIYMTCGAAASLSISLSAIVNEGDEVLVFAPFFPEYKVFIEQAKGKIRIVQAREKDFKIDFEELVKSINKNTKAVIINSPNNPSGVIYSKKDIVKLSEILMQKQKELGKTIFLISDEPYRELIYDDIKYPFVTNYYDNSIVCYSFSKSLSLPGERIGYIALSNKCIDAKRVFASICGAGRSLGYVCAPAIFQYIIPSCLGFTSDINMYKENRDLLYNMLTEIGYDVVYPDGAFYIFMKALEKDAGTFSEKAKKYDLLLVPSDSFGVNGYVRLAYCVEKKMIENSRNAFKELFDEYKGKGNK